eukprot:scaffold428_cov168-Ochromonas_danica.AAC.1
MKRHAEKLEEDLKQAQLTCAHQRDELKSLDQAEGLLSTVEGKMNGLSNHNRSLQKDLQSKENQVHRLQKQCQDLQNENAMLITEGEKLALQLQSKVDNLHEAEDRIQRLLIEVERLRTRQIDPELAKILQESHEKQRQQGGGGPGENHGGSTATTTAAGLRLSELQEVEVGLRSLIRKSDLMLSRAENFFLSLTSDQPALLVNQTGFTVLRDEVRLLLEENHSLLHRINAIYTSWKVEGGFNDGNSSGTSLQTARAIAAEIAAGAGRRTLTAEQNYFFPSRRGLMTPTNTGTRPFMNEHTATDLAPGFTFSSRGGMDLEDLRETDDFSSTNRRSSNNAMRSTGRSGGSSGGVGSGNGNGNGNSTGKDFNSAGRFSQSYPESRGEGNRSGSGSGHEQGRLQKFDANLRKLAEKLDKLDFSSEY